jgi:Surface antigen
MSKSHTMSDDLRQRILSKGNYQHSSKRYKGLARVKSLFAYAFVFVLVISFAFFGSRNDLRGSEGNAFVMGDLKQADIIPSVDQLIEANIVADLAEVANLPVAANTANTSVSLAIKYEVAQSSDTSIQKPQIVDISDLPRGIVVHKVVSGDSVASVAEYYGISTTTLRWANKLKANSGIKVGNNIVVPVVDGVVYVVRQNDTVAKIAKKYKSDEESIVIFNDLEFSKIKTGQKLVLPGGVLPANERPDYVEPRVTTPSYSGNYNYSYANYGGNLRIINRGIVPYSTSNGNRNAWGNCTWFAWEYRKKIGRPLPNAILGNANYWHISLAGLGYRVDRKPAVGAVMQTSAGWAGHVMVVVGISDSGDVTVYEMNTAGYNVVNERTFTAAQAAQYNYIH